MKLTTFLVAMFLLNISSSGWEMMFGLGLFVLGFAAGGEFCHAHNTKPRLANKVI